jgi:uncharacterized membrane protein YhaH (DUF805 family)
VEIQTCPNCFVKVLPSADGICPSCGQSLVVLAQTADGFPEDSGGTVSTGHQGDDGAMRQKQNPWSVVATSASSVDGHSNPFAAPARTANPVSRPLTPASGGLIWLLFSYSGRIARRHFWLASFGVLFVWYLTLAMLASFAETQDGGDRQALDLVVVASLLPFYWTTFAIQAKRWHDLDKSGWWSLIGFIPCGGFVALVLLGFSRGTFGQNRFGPDPT